LDLTPDGRQVLAAGTGERLHLWDAISGKQITTIPLPPRIGREGARIVFHVRLSADGLQAKAIFGAQTYGVVAGEPDIPPSAWLATWQLPAGELLAKHSLERLFGSLSRDGKKLVTSSSVVDLRTLKEKVRLEGVGKS